MHRAALSLSRTGGPAGRPVGPHRFGLATACAGLALSALLALATPTAGAQSPAPALDVRWHGTWQADDERLVITADAVTQDTERCRWVGTRPAAPVKQGCAAFYDQGITKAQITRLLDEAEREIRRAGKGRDARLSAEDRPALMKDLAAHRQTLRGLSEGAFRTVVLEWPEARGDCMTRYLLDKASVYAVTNCPYPEAHSLRRLTRQR